MRINRNNYEIWFLDYFEGNLSADKVDELMDFLELHYDLKEEFDSFENVSLPPSKKIVFDAKESLKKKTVIAVGSINEKNYEEFFIDAVEDNLTKEQLESLNTFIEKNPEMKKELDLFHKTKSIPDINIKFPDKESLHKNVEHQTQEINETNYPEFFIASFEDDLSEKEIEQLNSFLAKNPTLRKEYDLFSKVKISPDPEIVFEGKKALKKNVILSFGSINASNFAEHFIAAAEGDANLSQLTELKEFLALNPQLHKEFDLFKATILTPDKTIIFDRKNELKQAVSTKKLFNLTKVYYPVSIAASIILIVAVYLLFPKDGIKTINTASRNDFDIKRETRKFESIQVANENSNNIQNFAATTAIGKNNTFINETEYKDIQYASAIPVKTIKLSSEETRTELTEITVYEDFYAMMTKKRRLAEEEQLQQDNNKTLSLKDFALFNLKKSLAPADKKDKVTPDDPKITMWDVADAGVHKFNDITGANARLDRKKDNSGFSFALGDKFEISRSKGNNK